MLTIDQATGLGYLADKDNKAVVVFDTKTDKYVTRMTGFVGMSQERQYVGPNGARGGQWRLGTVGERRRLRPSRWSILKTNTITVDDCDRRQAPGQRHGLRPERRVVIVANSNDADRRSSA